MHSRSRLGETILIPKNWQLRLDDAANEEEVLELARQFTARLSTEDLARLPEYCRPGEINSRADIVRYVHTLLGHHCAGDGATERLVTRLASFFSAAAMRLASIPA